MAADRPLDFPLARQAVRAWEELQIIALSVSWGMPQNVQEQQRTCAVNCERKPCLITSLRRREISSGGAKEWLLIKPWTLRQRAGQSSRGPGLF